MVAVDENSCPNCDIPDMFFVPQKEFEVLKSKLAKGASITDEEADSLVNWTCKNSDIVIPLDLSAAGENLDDWDAALKRLGASKTVDCFAKAFAHFEANKHKTPEEERPKPMTAKQWKVENDEEDDEEDIPVYTPELFHLPKAAFEAIKVKLAQKQAISKQEADALVNWNMPDSEILMPVDMKGTDEDLDEFDEMLEKLGPETIVQNFVQAEKHLEKKRSLIAPEKLKLITIKQWKDGGYEEDGSEDEKAAEAEAEAEAEADEDDSEDGDEDDQEPEAKKAKAD